MNEDDENFYVMHVFTLFIYKLINSYIVVLKFVFDINVLYVQK